METVYDRRRRELKRNVGRPVAQQLSSTQAVHVWGQEQPAFSNQA